MALKTRAQRIKAYVHSSPMQMSHNVSAITLAKFMKFFTRRSCITVDVNAVIGVAILPSNIRHARWETTELYTERLSTAKLLPHTAHSG